jgi:tetratricopeptide (TPR) repeat protein
MTISLLVVLLTFAQEAPAGPLKQVLPADRQAYTDAQKIRDPEKRIEALEKALRDFPDSQLLKSSGLRMIEAARGNVFRALVKEKPQDRQALLGKAKQLLAASSEASRPRLYLSMAQSLADAKLYPKEAQNWARKAVAGLGEKPAELADARAALGQIYLDAGKLKPAEVTLRQALQGKAELASAALGLASILEKKGRAEEALGLLAQARLVRPSKETIERFEKAFGKGGQGKEEYLDARYKALYPAPHEAAAVQGKRSGRVVLAEVHTGAGCPPCLAADLAFDSMMERFSRQELVVLMVHQHIPRPDPMVNDDSTALWAERKGRGVPTYLLDGVAKIGGGGRAEVAGMRERLSKEIAERLEAQPEARLALQVRREGGGVAVAADWEALGGAEVKPVLRLALVEKMIRYSGENGVRFHPFVARALVKLPAAAARLEHRFDLEAVKVAARAHIDRFEVKNERHNPDGKFRFLERRDAIDEGQLAVIAYLEDEKGKVLQAAYADLL